MLVRWGHYLMCLLQVCGCAGWLAQALVCSVWVCTREVAQSLDIFMQPCFGLSDPVIYDIDYWVCGRRCSW